MGNSLNIAHSTERPDRHHCNIPEIVARLKRLQDEQVIRKEEDRLLALRSLPRDKR